MNSSYYLNQIESLKREKVNNDNRISQEQRSVSSYEQQASNYKKTGR